MFDYSTLVNQVRRTLNDNPTTILEETASFPKSSYYITLGEDGYATVLEDSLIIDDGIVSSDFFTVDGNIIQLTNIIDAGSSVSVRYSIIKYSDSDILNMIGDTISNVVEPMLNKDFEFGSDPTKPTITQQVIDKNIIALFVRGTVMNMAGINLLTSTSDAIMIRDGDTVINTSVASSEAIKGYASVLKEWNELLKTVRNNKFSGVCFAE